MTPGKVMVASTVAKLATIIDGEEDSSRRMGFETILPLREGNGPTLFCFHPASGFALQFSVLSRYLHSQWSIIGIQSPRPHGPMQTAIVLDEVCEAHLATLLEQQPHGHCGATACPWRTGGISWLAGDPAARNAKLAGKRS